MAGTRDYSDGEIIWKQRKRNWCRTKFSFTVYTLTDSELIIEQGIIRQKIDSIPLYRILDYRGAHIIAAHVRAVNCCCERL